MNEIGNFYKILKNVNAALRVMLQKYKKTELYVILPEKWRSYLFERKTILGIEIKYNDKLDVGVVINKNDNPFEFSIPECANSNGELN